MNHTALPSFPFTKGAKGTSLCFLDLNQLAPCALFMECTQPFRPHEQLPEKFFPFGYAFQFFIDRTQFFQQACGLLIAAAVFHLD